MKMLVIGGGVAGFSAAVALTQQRHDVTVLEARSFCGGRAYSFHDPKSGEIVDNGQHLLMGAYRATFDYLRTIGSLDQVAVDTTFRVPLVTADGQATPLNCPKLPAPWHLLVGLARLRGYSWKDLRGLMGGQRALRQIDAASYAQWDGQSVTQWLDSIHQSAKARELLWEPVTLAGMNETPDRASAAPFLMMLREGTFQRGIDQGLAFPRVGLSQLLVDPALSWLTEQGASVLTGKPVASINISDSTVHSVTLKNGDIREADAFVCALPPRELHQLMQRSGLADDEPWSRLTRWESVPIMSVHLWYDRPILPQPMVGLIGSRFHWAFDKSLCAMRHAPCAKEKMARPAHSAQRIAHSKSCIALILSACREEVQWSRAETIEKATDEIARYFPQSRHATLQHAQVTKELHATVSVAKGSAAARLSARTPWPNMVLAGDWTQTYLPATIEGAIRSGENAANLCSNVEPKLWQPLDQRVPINLR